MLAHKKSTAVDDIHIGGGYRPELWPPTRPLVDGARLVHVPDLTQEEQVEE